MQNLLRYQKEVSKQKKYVHNFPPYSGFRIGMTRVKNVFLLDSQPTSRFELSISWLWNVIYFSFIVMPKKYHFTIFVIQNYVQNTKKNTSEFHLFCWDHVCKINEWCFHHKFWDSTQIMVATWLLYHKMQKVFCLSQFKIFVNLNPELMLFLFC